MVVWCIERDPDHRRVEQVPRIARLHRRAAPLLDTDESPLLELLEAFADHRPAEAELLAERRLRREDAPFGKGAADDLCASSSSTIEARRAGRRDRVPSSTSETPGGVRTLSTRNIICSGHVGTIPQRQLPNGGAVLSELSLGCAQLGNLYREVPDAEAQATVDSAWELGVRYFDTAPHYGLGLSERRLGAALASRPRDAYVISSKVGRLLEPIGNPGGLDDDGYVVPATHRRVWDFSRDGIRRSLTESLGAAGPRSGRHRLSPRPGRALGGSARDRLPGARRTARPGRRQGHRRRNEPGVDARATSSVRRTSTW